MTTVTASASSDLISVHLRADGSVEQLRIDDRALASTGAALAEHITEVMGRAHTELVERRRATQAALFADPRIAEASAVVEAAMDKPWPQRPVVREQDPDDYVRPVSYLMSALDQRR
ncbi:hypothetical protein M1M07_17190 [Rhodococcus sp. HM1]|uniref:hypothetical protein n=1 Tax=unclassified Rhodococcus (in: high G+C Gram-positive bacteria) TaxID=192944 RepID=UPI0018CE6C18|nr:MULTISPECIES: hypothetical protein [unclassified Rhodococcus (in: high G+C Gram-positive bacteria)]MBH0119808.1 hypothetical protein [Rhodococcus sp. CX]MCK8672833.1 hypothetical protein [Rhodococcus sp. HM1]